jgi:hypothetical protein
VNIPNTNEFLDGVLEGVINAVISVIITYGVYALGSSSVDITFALVAVAATAFFTGYFTLTGGGVSYFSKEDAET